jgi:excisionase family DNA binding protein
MEPEMLRERVYTLKDVAAIIGMTRRYVLNQIHNGALIAERYGTAWRVRERDLLRFIEDRRQTRAS